MRILAADIGLGTTDILIYDSDLAIENCPKLVIPSQTRQVAARITEATRSGLAVAMTGVTMGGGPCSAALRKHLEAGLSFYATPLAAKTFNDDLDVVRSWGVNVNDGPIAGAPEDSVEIPSGDIDLSRLSPAFEELGINSDFDGAALAVQDHGFAPGESNRRYRFSLWEETIAREPSLDRLAYLAPDIPTPYNRMHSAASLVIAAHVVVMDTGPAAVLGATLPDPSGARLAPGETAVVVNMGNGHTLAAAVRDRRITGIVEHHTRLLDRDRLVELLERFAAGTLTNDDVFDDGGHGCIPPPDKISVTESSPLIVTGPRRGMILGSRLPFRMASPCGDMMLSGCFGLVVAYARLIELPLPENIMPRI